MKKNVLLLFVFLLSCFFVKGTEPLKIPDDDVTLKISKIEGDLNEIVEIDLMIVYTQAAKNWAESRGGIITRITQGMGLSQLVYDNSQVGIKLNLVYAMEIDYVETGNSLVDLRRLTFGYDMAFDGYLGANYMPEVRAMRDSVGADLVMLIPASGDAAGLAWQLSQEVGRPTYGYSVVMVHYLNQLTKVHEMGHNMGAHHHRDQLTSPGPGLWDYSSGWRWVGSDNSMYVSVMSYPSGSSYADRLGGRRISYFSNPSIMYMGGYIGDSLLADNARTLRQIKHTIAAYRNRPIPVIEIPKVQVFSISSITTKSANVILKLISDGGDDIDEIGFWLGTESDPEINGIKFIVDTVIVQNLNHNTTYYVKPYATNSVGIGYGEIISFKTLEIKIPIVSISPIYDITTTSAKTFVGLINDGNDNILELGVCWGLGEIPTIENNIIVGQYINFQDLQQNTIYYARAYAINSIGVGYSEILSFKTEEITIPFVRIKEITDITTTSAKTGVNLIDDGNSDIIELGVCWGLSNNPTINDSYLVGEDVIIQNLESNTTYYVRAYAINAVGVGYSNTLSFKTIEIKIPTVSTKQITDITTISAKTGVILINNGNDDIIELGVCWGLFQSPTIDDNYIVGENVTIQNLTPNTTYFVRAYAINSIGVGYGENVVFTTKDIPVVIPPINSIGVRIYPNPSTGTVNVEYIYRNYRLRILTQTGTQVLNTNPNIRGIYMVNLRKGTYIFILEQPNKKIIHSETIIVM